MIKIDFLIMAAIFCMLQSIPKIFTRTTQLKLSIGYLLMRINHKTLYFSTFLGLLISQLDYKRSVIKRDIKSDGQIKQWKWSFTPQQGLLESWDYCYCLPWPISYKNTLFVLMYLLSFTCNSHMSHLWKYKNSPSHPNGDS